LEPRKGAAELLQDLKLLGYYIVILSSRPVNKYNGLIMQTTNWLEKEKLKYDYIIFEKEKHLEIIQKFGNVKFVVEDNRFFAESIAQHGYKVFLMNNRYNQGATSSNIMRINYINNIMRSVESVGR
jgi:uncharacterized HAD superfamily protein